MRRPRVLVFADFVPVPVDRGDKNRLFHVLKLLQQSTDVRLVCLQRSWEPLPTDLELLDGIETRVISVAKQEVIWQGIKAMMGLKPFIVFRFALPRVVDQVCHEVRGFRPDVLWGYGISTYPFFRRARGITRVLDLVDSPSLVSRMTLGAQAISLRARAMRMLQWRMRHYERLALLESDCVLVASRRDQEHLLRTHGDYRSVQILENCVPQALMARQWQPRPDRLPKVLFVGHMAYPPNASGVRYFAHRIWPLIRAQVKGVEFVVCGRGGNRLAKELGSQAGIRVVGYVGDLVPEYLSASTLVVPVPMAGGTQYKLLEAMALGLPIVASRQAAEVGEMIHGQELLVGDSAESFASAVVSILHNPEQAAHLSANGRAFILAHHTWEGKADLVRSVISGPG